MPIITFLSTIQIPVQFKPGDRLAVADVPIELARLAVNARLDGAFVLKIEDEDDERADLPPLPEHATTRRRR